jgi:L-threonylcarbamoyladenylate synthase
MNNRICKLSECGLEAAAQEIAAAFDLPGAVVLLPTETVYGLVCCSDDPEAIRRIYYLKHRSAEKPLGWFVGDWRKLPDYGVKMEGLPAELAGKYCPGAITIIAPKEDGSTQGFRVPDHPLLKRVLELVGLPLCQTSANLSGRPDALTAEAAAAELIDKVDLVVDGGAIAADAMASTVVLATGDEPVILRQGGLRLQK